MYPQIIEYKESIGVLKKLENTNTYVISSNDMLWKGMKVPPCILVNGITEKTLKFDFYKVYNNEGFDPKHVEYKNTDVNASLIIYNAAFSNESVY